MSSTFVADSTVDGKSDDTLIIFVNADGSISVDPDTLNRLLANQHHTSGVSVVRLGQPDNQNDGQSESTDCSDVNLTVEGFYPPGSATSNALTKSNAGSNVSSTSAAKAADCATKAAVNTTTLPVQAASANLSPSVETITSTTVSQSSDVPPLVPIEGSSSAGGDVLADPFSEMDPDQLKRLETALQSEHAKQILGENVTAMFDMLKVDGDGGEMALNDSIRMDHCYTKGSIPNASSTPIASTTSAASTGTPSLTQVVVQTPAQSPASSQVTLIRGKGKGKAGSTTASITTSTPTISTTTKNTLNAVVSGATLVPVLRPLILPAGATQFATVHTISGNLGIGQKLILPQNQVIVAQDVGSPQVQSPQKVLVAVPQLQTLSVAKSNIASTDLNKQSITIATFETPKKKSIGARGRSIRGGRIRGEGRRTPAGRGKGGKGESALLKNDELVASLEALHTSPPVGSTSGTDAKNTKVPSILKRSNLKTVNKSPDGSKKSHGGDLKKGPRQTKLIEHLEKLSPKVKVKPTKKVADSTTPVNSLASEMSSATALSSPHTSAVGFTSEVATLVSPTSTTQLPTISSSATSTPDAGNSKSSDSLNVENSQQLKKYPKRENRKPPAHLAEALGPALFSTPDIIRRVSTDKPCAQTPTTPGTEANEVGPETLLDTIHAQVSSQEDLLFEADNLLLEELSNLQEATEVLAEEDVSGIVDIVTSTETLDTEVVRSQLDGSSDVSRVPPAVVADDKITPTAVTPAPIPMEVDSPNKVSDPLTLKADAHLSSDSSLPQGQPQQLHSLRKLPPVELPATRSASKRASQHHHQHQQDVQLQPQLQPQAVPELKPSTESSHQKSSAAIATRGNRKSAESKSSISRVSTSEEEYPSDDDEEDYNSEDDPDRLWCICQKPHNNRFMICCDSCEEWFHGKCVGITKAIGKQIEQQGVEWKCPNCKVKTDQDQSQPVPVLKTVTTPTATGIATTPTPTTTTTTTPTAAATASTPVVKAIPKSQTQKSVPAEAKVASDAKPAETKGDKHKETKSPRQTTLKFHFERNQTQAQSAGTVYCIVCKKPATAESIYCSDECIVKHGEESLEFITKERGDISGKSQTDTRVIVAERKTGRLIAGPNAPLASNLISWLKNHPTYEIVRPSQLPTSKFYSQPKPATAVKPNTPQPSKVLKHSPGSASSAMKQTTLAGKPGSKQIMISPKPPIVKTNKIVLIEPKPQPPVLTKSQIAKSEANTENLSTTSKKESESSEQKKTPLADKKPSQKQAQALAATPKTAPTASPKTAPTASPKTATTATVKTTANAPKRTQRRSSSGKDEFKTATPRRKSESEGKPSRSSEESSKPEPIRLNVKKTLHELLMSRVKEAGDIKIEDEAVVKIAHQIEEELFSLFKDTGTKYKSKYRSIIFNIKDPKNLTLFREVADSAISPQQLVRLSPEEMANQELAQWREREVRHQLEMIKKNELELLHQAKTVVMKTHKGEQIIEADEALSSKPEASLTELERSLNSENLELNEEITAATKNKETVELISQKEDKEKASRQRSSSSGSNRKDDKEHRSRSKKKDKKHNHKDHRRSRSSSRGRKRHRSRSNDKSESESKSRHSRSKSRHSRSKSRHSRSKSRHNRSSKSSDRKSVEIDQKKEMDVDRERSKSRSRKSVDFESVDIEPVDIESVVTPFLEEETINEIEEPFNSKEIESDLSDREPSSTVIIKTPPYIEENPALWKGNLVMNDVAKFETSILEVSGDCEFLGDDLPRTIDCVGRIHPDTVWDYISKMKKSGTKQIVVVRLAAESEEEKVSYLSLYSYLSSRNRMGVVGNNLDMIKDFYIYPLGSHSPIPQVLLPLDGPGFEDFRPHLLLGIIVRTRRQRVLTERDIQFVPKVKTSQSQPAVQPERSYTPPLPEAGGSLTPPHPPPPSFDALDSLSRSSSESSKKKKKMRFSSYKSDSVASLSPTPDIEDGDAPYSPGGPGNDDDDDEPYSPGEDGESGLQNSPPPTDLQKKMEELNRKIEEQTQEIQSISCAIGGDSIQENMEEEVEEEAYSPSRSFTPPPTESIPFLDSGMNNISLPKNLQEILASIKKVEEPTSSKPITLKLDPIVQAYSSESAIEAYSPDAKDSASAADGYIPSNVKVDLVAEDSSQASSSLSKDSSSVNEVAQKVNRDPRQRIELIKKAASKSSLSQLTDDDLIKKAAEMGFIDSDKQEVKETVEKIEIEQPPPPGIEEEEYGSQFPVQSQCMTTPFTPFPPGPSSLPMISPIPVTMTPPINTSVPPPPLPMHTSMASLAPPIPFPQGFSNPPPPLPPLPPPMPPPPPSTTTISAFQSSVPPPPLPPPPSFKLPSPKQNPVIPSEKQNIDIQGPSMSLKDHRSHVTKKKRKFSDDSRNDLGKKKVREDRGGGVWKREVPVPPRDFEPHSSRGQNNARYAGGHRGFHQRGRGRKFERGRGMGGRDSAGNWSYYREYQQRNFSNPPPPSPENIQNEWDEEIRNFEQQRERRQKFKTNERHWPKDGDRMRRRKYPPGNE